MAYSFEEHVINEQVKKKETQDAASPWLYRISVSQCSHVPI